MNEVVAQAADCVTLSMFSTGLHALIVVMVGYLSLVMTLKLRNGKSPADK